MVAAAAAARELRLDRSKSSTNSCACFSLSPPPPPPRPLVVGRTAQRVLLSREKVEQFYCSVGFNFSPSKSSSSSERAQQSIRVEALMVMAIHLFSSIQINFHSLCSESERVRVEVSSQKEANRSSSLSRSFGQNNLNLFKRYHHFLGRLL